MPNFSVVIPVHNTHTFLARCLNSVLAQTLSDWECILVDDGSTDASGELCDAYARQDSRFQVIHQSNQGSAAARNNGLAHAQGKYLLFLDSDDLWPPYLLETLYAAQQNRPEDLILWRFTSQLDALAGKECSFTHFGPDQAGRLYLESCLYYVWNKLFHLNVIRTYNLRFPAGIVYGEDVQFAMAYVCQWFRLHPKASFCLSDDALYYYEGENQNSVTYRLKPCYCGDEILLTEQALHWFTVDFPPPPEHFYHLLVHLLKTIAGGLAVDLDQPCGVQSARNHLSHPTVQQLLSLAAAQGCYSPFLFLMNRGHAIAAGRLGRYMLRDSRFYHRIYWLGWHLHRLRTGRKAPVIL